MDEGRTLRWVQGAPLPPAVQAIISSRYFRRNFLECEQRITG